MAGFKLFSSASNKKASSPKEETVPDLTTNDEQTVKEAPEPAADIIEETLQESSVARRSDTFKDLGISQWLTDSLQQLSIYKPTEIQQACIPPILQGKNCIGSAKTGSGKTAAFALPILQKLSQDPYGVFALILTPTRELAFQIGEQFKALGDGVSLRQAVVVGGMDMMRQALELQKRPHVVIATPGRLVDHLRNSNDVLFLKKLRFLVLDEADRLFEDSFADDLDFIISQLPADKQTLLFSATMTPEIEALKTERTFLYSMTDRHDTVAKLDQRYIMTPSLVRDSYLVWLLQQLTKADDKTMIMIFTGKCLSCELLRVMLYQLEFKVTALHSQMTQVQRINSLARFRTGVCPILISTDVGSRGLDIPSVKYVINYDVPASATDYVHRVGRTARAGRGGKAITLATEIDLDLLDNIETKIKRKLELEPVNEKEINEQLKKIAEAKKDASLHLHDINFGEKSRINKMKQGIDPAASRRAKKQKST